MPDVGSFRVAELSVVGVDGVPGDGTTVAALTVTADGVTTTPAVNPVDGGARWVSEAYELTVAGEWFERWLVAGRGAGRTTNVVLVGPDLSVIPAGVRVYATTRQYAEEWLRAAPPAGSRRALVAASGAVDDMLFASVYPVDDDGYPTKAAHVRALMLATCAQAEYGRSIGDPFGVGANRVASLSIGSVSISRGSGPGGTSEPGRYAPEAWRILVRAGLTGHEPAGA